MAAAELSGGALTGTVVTRDGWPVSHAVVTVIDSTGAQSAVRMPSSRPGRFVTTASACGLASVGQARSA